MDKRLLDMSGSYYIGQNAGLSNLLRHAETVVTKEGNTYYKFPCWFQMHSEKEEFSIHSIESIPEDLSEFLTKAGLGGDNPQPIKAKL